MGKPQHGHTVMFLDGNSLNVKRNNLVQIPFFTKTHVNKNNISTKSSIYRGVHVKNGFYFSRITYNGISKYLGRFKTEKEAAFFYDLKAIELYKEFAQTNIVQNPFIQNTNPNPK